MELFVRAREVLDRMSPVVTVPGSRGVQIVVHSLLSGVAFGLVFDYY